MQIYDSIHSCDYTVHTYDVDRYNTVYLSYFFQLMQETAAQHSKCYHLTISDLKVQQKTWVVIRQRLSITRYPQWLEPIQLQTWVTKPSPLIAPRSFLAIDKLGNILFRGLSYWCIIDLAHHHPVPLASVYQSSGINDADRQITDPIGKPGSIPDSYTNLYTYHPSILYRDTDTNGHVNNRVYCDWCLESVPPHIRDGHNPSMFEIHYNKETYDTDTILVKTHMPADHSGGYHQIYALREGKELLVCTVKSCWEHRAALG